MIDISKYQPSEDESEREERARLNVGSDNVINDPLEVVSEEEQSEEVADDTQDDMFDDDELDLDLTLDSDDL